MKNGIKQLGRQLKLTDEEYDVIKKFAVELSHFADLKTQLQYYAAENEKLKERIKELESKVKEDLPDFGEKCLCEYSSGAKHILFKRKCTGERGWEWSDGEYGFRDPIAWKPLENIDIYGS